MRTKRASTRPALDSGVRRPRWAGLTMAAIAVVSSLATLTPSAVDAQTKPAANRGEATQQVGLTEPTLTPEQRQAVDQLSASSGAPIAAAADPDTGVVTALVADDGHALAGSAGGPEASAIAFVESQQELLGVSGELIAETGTDTLSNGSSVKLTQTVDGVPVLGGEVAVTLDADNRPTAMIADLLPEPDVDTTPQLSAAEAAPSAIEAATTAHPGAADLTASAGELMVYNPVLLGGPGIPVDRLVWQFEVTSRAGLVRELVLIDAQRGFVALQIDQIHRARERSVCNNANNPAAANTTCAPPSVRDEGDPATGDTQVDLAYDYAGDTYDFFFDNFGRNSIDDEGMPLISTVRYCHASGTCPLDNAGWTGTQMIYGDGYGASDDVVGHEFAHGVTQHTSNLLYWYESGAINEAMSDVFGELIDLGNGAGNDAAGVRWLMGEEIPIGAIRSMANPPAYGDPDKMTSANYWSDPSDSGGVHENSGVANKAAFLMTDGGTFNGVTVTALGPTKTAAIWYETNATLLTSGADYADLDLALVAACHNLIGTFAISPANCVEVSDATVATEMHLRPVLPGQQNEAPVCPAGSDPTYLFDDDMENTGSGNWVTQTISGSNNWDYPWNGYATSGTTSVSGYPQPTVGNSVFAMTTNVALPPGSTPYLRFSRAYEFQSGNQDGMVLEYSTTGGASWLDAAALLTNNGYTGTIAAATNPLNARSAFVGTTRGYTSTRATLNTLAGSNVRFRFRMGTDSSINTFGAFIDDVQIYTCAPTTNLVVNTTADTVDTNPGNGFCADAGAQCSLRAAIQEANALAGANTITLPATGSFTLTRVGASEDQALTGDLDVRNSPLTINGNNAVINGNGLDRVFNVHKTGFTARDLTITGGNVASHGGGLLSISSTPMTLENVNVSDNTAAGQGGGIFAAGSLVIDGGRVAGNAATGSGGGLAMIGALDLDGTTVEGNTSARDAGGLYLVGPGPMAVANASVIDNSTTRHAGGVYIDAPYTVTDSTISGNAAGAGTGFGGGLGVGSVGSVTRTTLANNTAYLGGGLMALGTITVSQTTLSNNTAAGGGGAALAGPTATIVNSTISGNTATAFGGGGILNTSTLGLSSSTVTANNSGGLYTLGAGEFGLPGGTSAVANTIIANQTTGSNCTGLGTIVSGGRNLTSTVGCSFTGAGDQQNVNPLLGPLADNAGPTLTHEPQVGSPAIGTAYPSCPATDQRGAGRPQGGSCDTGAVETFGATVDLNLVVNSTVDAVDAAPGNFACATAAGVCTLRAAIMEANAFAGNHTITLVAGATYTLTRAGINEDQAVNGDLDLRRNITIVAPGAGATVDINDLDRVFQVHAPSIARLQNIKATDGNAGADNGGGVLVGSSASLFIESGSTVTSSNGGYGAGVLNFGTVTVQGGSDITTNTAVNSGGGIYNAGTLTVTGAGTSVAGNTANWGGGIYSQSGTTVSVTTSATIANNTASYGGGIYTSNATTTASVTSGATIDNNTATVEGGGFWNLGTMSVTNAIVSNNDATAPAGANRKGGGFVNANGATLTITDSRISGNTAGVGATSGFGGGGINFAALTVLRSTFSANTALDYGGAIENEGTSLSIEDSTISGNSALAGGGILNFTAMTMRDSTMTLNTATGGAGYAGGLYNNGGGGTATIGNSIISANASNDDCGGGGTYTTNGYNYRGATCGGLAAGTDVNGAAPNLAALANNGGSTLTHLPNVGSPVIGTGNPACSGTDQRGLARPQGGTCDKGAVDRA